MPLTPGSRIGVFEITARIGQGGMGEVYQATDTNLKRQVAIKVLPDAVAGDAERLARFQREAEVLASLNHPGIAAIYGLERTDGQTALVMELVEGPTLADRIAQGAIPVDEALPIAKQIAEALEAAHEQGFIHRDLKPANIKLRPDGTVKVLDFGLAKAMEPAAAASPSASMSPTITTPAMTQAGLILGTAAYMSPEQARGRAVDARTDVWAFGAVLYEMLTGRRAFAGDDVTETLADVMRVEPNWTLLPSGLSPSLVIYLKRSLQKDQRQRIPHVADMRLALEGAFETAAPDVTGPMTAARPVGKQPLPLAAGLAVGVFVTALVGWVVWPAPEPGPVRRFTIELPEGQAFVNPGRPVLALAPDASAVVYVATEGLYLRLADALEPQRLPGIEGPAAVGPVFSPDGRQVAYVGPGGRLMRISTTGGAPVVVADVRALFGLSWAADGMLLVGQPDGIYQVPATGGMLERVIPARDGERLYGAELLPDGESVLFSATTGDWDEAQIVVQSRGRDDRTVLVEGGSDARYVRTGHLVYALGDGLFGMAFDPDRRVVSGGAVPLVQSVRRSAGNATGAAHYSVSATGELAYVLGASLGDNRNLLWVDPAGRTTAIPTPAGAFETVDVAPDGRMAALGQTSQASGDADVWVSDLERGTLVRLTSDAGFDGAPLWSPDGQRLAYVSTRDGRQEVVWRPVDGSGGAEALATFDGPVVQLVPGDWTPDGSQLVLAIAREGGDKDIGVVTVGAPQSFRALVEAPLDQRNPAVSPDGRWLAYASNETRTYQVYVQRFPDGGGLQQVSSEPGHSPKWSADGRTLSFVLSAPGGAPLSMARVSVTPGQSASEPLQFGATEELFPFDFYSQAGGQWWFDMTADGERFLAITGGAGGNTLQTSEVIVVQNWFSELERLVPTN